MSPSSRLNRQPSSHVESSLHAAGYTASSGSERRHARGGTHGFLRRMLSVKDHRGVSSLQSGPLSDSDSVTTIRTNGPLALPLNLVDDDDFASDLLESISDVFQHNSGARDTIKHNHDAAYSAVQLCDPRSPLVASTDSLPQSLDFSLATASDDSETRSTFFFSDQPIEVPIRSPGSALAREEFYDVTDDDDNEWPSLDMPTPMYRASFADEFETNAVVAPRAYLAHDVPSYSWPFATTSISEDLEGELQQQLAVAMHGASARAADRTNHTAARLRDTVATQSPGERQAACMVCTACQQAVQEDSIVRVRNNRIVHLECCRDSPPPSYDATHSSLNATPRDLAMLESPFAHSDVCGSNGFYPRRPRLLPGLMRSPNFSVFAPFNPSPDRTESSTSPVRRPSSIFPSPGSHSAEVANCYGHCCAPTGTNHWPPYHTCLPVEVWEDILSLLLDEPEALLACAFVCKAWYACCRQHLSLGVLQLRHHSDVIRLSRYVRAHRAFAGREFVTIQGGVGRSLLHLPTFTALLAGRMPHLGSLFIEDGVWWTGMTDDGFFTRVASFASVVRLSLNDVTFPSTTVFARFVCALEQLEELYCVNIKTVKKRTGRELFLPLRHSSKLSHFTLVGSQVHDIIDFVVASGLSQRITDLCLHVGSVDYRSFAHLDAVAYRDLFSACWSLRTLHLQLRDAAVAKTHAT
ncbi:uncharacterized protein C8Q71DRAFT_260108 [Rhodofomes roseus]|uniref:F-box domain-containing protein n=1 Tax=Rhodofomes roseus TaxID=34475 RepID=A0ABQ8K6S7_9APHY|nr:uncharacterized protein C8Q71DRAFT_260108 [Rhodofomes roseus]KAH9832580.1 hypothetical protein C8Q71DRAFT_260108 [Rhodofomes roseus]